MKKERLSIVAVCLPKLLLRRSLARSRQLHGTRSLSKHVRNLLEADLATAK